MPIIIIIFVLCLRNTAWWWRWLWWSRWSLSNWLMSTGATSVANGAHIYAHTYTFLVLANALFASLRLLLDCFMCLSFSLSLSLSLPVWWFLFIGHQVPFIHPATMSYLNVCAICPVQCVCMCVCAFFFFFWFSKICGEHKYFSFHIMYTLTRSV